MTFEIFYKLMFSTGLGAILTFITFVLISLVNTQFLSRPKYSEIGFDIDTFLYNHFNIIWWGFTILYGIIIFNIWI